MDYRGCSSKMIGQCDTCTYEILPPGGTRKEPDNFGGNTDRNSPNEIYYIPSNTFKE